MNPLATVERLGWVLVHSVWQFAALSIVAAVLLRAMRRRSADVRYGALVALLAAAAIAPIATWCLVDQGEDFDTSTSRRSGRDIATMSAEDAPPEAGDDPLSRIAAAEMDINAISMSGVAARPTDDTLVAVPLPSWSERISSTIRPWLSLLVVGWMIGVSLCAARPLMGWRMMWRLRRVGTSAVSREIQFALERIAARLGVQRCVHVMLSTLTHAPLVVGYLRPVILLPVSLVISLPMNQLEAILAHELAHVRRHDFVVNLLQTMIETLFFYHPAIWWISGRIRLEREHCCDDLVVSAFDNRVDYGRALLAAAELRGESPILAIGATDGELLTRIRRLAGTNRDRMHRGFLDRSSPVLFCAACLAAMAVVGFDLWRFTPVRDSDETPDSAVVSEMTPATEGDQANVESDVESPRQNAQPIEPGLPAVAHLPDGISVELVGMTKNTVPANDGWRPDGGPIGDVGSWRSTIVLHDDHSSSAYVENGPHPEPDANAIDILFRYRGLTSQPSLTYDLPSKGSSFHHWPVQDPYEVRVSTRLRGNLPTRGKWTIPDGLIRIGLTEEPWGRYVKIAPDGTILDPVQPEDRYASTYDLIKVLGTRPYERAPGGTTIVLREPRGFTDPADPLHRYAFEFRAVDTEGRNHWAHSWSSRAFAVMGGDPLAGWNESLYALAEPLPEGKTLSHYEYRLRPYRHWVTFKNVAMAPDERTKVRVSVTAAPKAPASLPPPVNNADEEQVFRKLNQPTQVAFIEMQLDQSLAFLSEYHHTLIRLDVDALSDADVAIDAPVSLERERASFQRILNLLTVPLELQWYVDGKEIVVTTRAAAAKALVARFESRPLPDLQLLDYLCGLSESQRRRLQLAARGIFSQLVREIDLLADAIRRAEDDDELSSEGYDKIERLQTELAMPSLSGGLTFRKAVEAVLTPDQVTAYAPLRAVRQLGGYVGTLKSGGDVLLGAVLIGTSVSDDDLTQLKNFHALQVLRLDGTAIGDDGLSHLKDLTNLRELYLGSTMVTDQGLAHLKNLRKLTLLDVSANGQITESGITELKRTLPDLDVKR